MNIRQDIFRGYAYDSIEEVNDEEDDRDAEIFDRTLLGENKPEILYVNAHDLSMSGTGSLYIATLLLFVCGFDSVLLQLHAREQHAFISMIVFFCRAWNFFLFSLNRLTANVNLTSNVFVICPVRVQKNCRRA